MSIFAKMIHFMTDDCAVKVKHTKNYAPKGKTKHFSLHSFEGGTHWFNDNLNDIM